MSTQTFASGRPVSASTTSSVKVRKPGGAVCVPIPPPPEPLPPDPVPEVPGTGDAAGDPVAVGAVVGTAEGGVVATTTTEGATLVRPRRFFVASITVIGWSRAAAPL